jgi:hypothetical protein
VGAGLEARGDEGSRTRSSVGRSARQRRDWFPSRQRQTGLRTRAGRIAGGRRASSRPPAPLSARPPDVDSGHDRHVDRPRQRSRRSCRATTPEASAGALGWDPQAELAVEAVGGMFSMLPAAGRPSGAASRARSSQPGNLTGASARPACHSGRSPHRIASTRPRSAPAATSGFRHGLGPPATPGCCRAPAPDRAAGAQAASSSATSSANRPRRRPQGQA